jgi:hypothetical protein
MLYAYFGGAGTDGARYELLLIQDKTRYTVLAEHEQPPALHAARGRTWFPCLAKQQQTRQRSVIRLYHGRDALIALRVMLRAACAAANSAQLGQRYCYPLPTGGAGSERLAPLIPPQLRHNNALPEHPLLWQVGRSLAYLPVERHAQACRDRRVFGDERIGWAWVRA